MTPITYGLTEEKYTLGSDTRISYGIAAYADPNPDGTAAIVVSVHDVSSDREMLAELIENCNRLELSILHLHDVVENFLADQQIAPKQ